MSVILASSHLQGSSVIYFMLLQCMCSWARLWVITYMYSHTHTHIFFSQSMHSILPFFHFPALHFRWVTLDGTASVAAPHANQRPSTSACRDDRAQSPFPVLLCGRRWWGKRQMYVLPFLPAEDQGYSKHLFTLLLSSLLLLSARYMWLPFRREPSKDKIQYCAMPLCVCLSVCVCNVRVSRSSIISDLVILIAHKRKVGVEERG